MRSIKEVLENHGPFFNTPAIREDDERQAELIYQLELAKYNTRRNRFFRGVKSIPYILADGLSSMVGDIGWLPFTATLGGVVYDGATKGDIPQTAAGLAVTAALSLVMGADRQRGARRLGWTS